MWDLLLLRQSSKFSSQQSTFNGMRSGRLGTWHDMKRFFQSYNTLSQHRFDVTPLASESHLRNHIKYIYFGETLKLFSKFENRCSIYVMASKLMAQKYWNCLFSLTNLYFIMIHNIQKIFIWVEWNTYLKYNLLCIS